MSDEGRHLCAPEYQGRRPGAPRASRSAVQPGAGAGRAPGADAGTYSHPIGGINQWAGSTNSHARNGRMTKLGHLQFTQQFSAAEHNEASIVTRERVPGGQQGVNGFAGADEIHGLDPNSRKHSGLSSRTGRQGVGEGIRSLTAPTEKRYRTCFVRSF
jgi:hypothetical protein